MVKSRRKQLQSFLTITSFLTILHSCHVLAATQNDHEDGISKNITLPVTPLAGSLDTENLALTTVRQTRTDDDEVSDPFSARSIQTMPLSLPSPYSRISLREPIENEDLTLNLLVFCGGGVRGIMGLRFMQRLCEGTNKHPYEMFHVISGTSIGGSSAGAFTRPKSRLPHEQNVPANSANHLFNFMRHNMNRMFTKNFWSLGGLWGPRYKSEPPRALAEEIFGDFTVDESLTDTMIVAHDLVAGRPFIFRSWDKREKFYTKDATIATGAAPTYFEPAKVYPVNTTDEEHTGYDLSDGGTDANNSILCALTEAIKRYPGARKIRAVVLGTGKSQNPLHYETTRKMGLLGWVSNLIPMIMDGQDAKDNFIAKSIIGSVIPGVYSYWNPTIPPENVALDNINPKNIDELIAFEDDLIRERSEEFRELVQHLSRPKAPLVAARRASLPYM